MSPDVPPGWYPDPALSSALRWWDGTAWTAHVSAPTGYAGPLDLDDEARRGRWARAALVVAIPAQLVSTALFRLHLRALFDQVRHLDTRAGSTPPPFTRGSWAGPAQASAAAGLVIGVLFLLWFARSAANARALGLPARREPAAGVAGFVVPVINLWWPYQSTCDLLAPGDPRRSLVLHWFLLWLVGGLCGAAASSVSLFVDGWAGWALLVVPVGLVTLAALAARRMITEVGMAHASLARQ